MPSSGLKALLIEVPGVRRLTATDLGGLDAASLQRLRRATASRSSSRWDPTSVDMAFVAADNPRPLSASDNRSYGCWSGATVSSRAFISATHFLRVFERNPVKVSPP